MLYYCEQYMSVTETILDTFANLYGKIFGSANDRELRRLWPIVMQVNDAWQPLRGLTDEQLQAKTAEFRRRLLNGEDEDRILPEAFAVCREASHRVVGQKRMVQAKYESLVYENGKFTYKPMQGEIPLYAHFDVQILGGIVLHEGNIAEMVTGEGKTLVATLPVYLNSLRPVPEWEQKARELQGGDIQQWIFKPYGLRREEDGSESWELLETMPFNPENGEGADIVKIIPVSRGVHVVTVNDYLAKRDADWNRPLYEFLGLSVGAIQSPMGNAERIPIYMCDITYGTNNEFGFDYLRDNLKVDLDDQVQRSRFFAVVDEVDSVLVDEARTPLIISGSAQESTDMYYEADRVARKLKGGDMNKVEPAIAAYMKQGMQREEARIAAEEDFDYVYSERDHSAKLTERGMHKVLRLLGMKDIYAGENLGMPHYIDNALKAHALYKKDHHYIVENGEVYIVDEFTGRKMEGRRWSDGLHQAVEAKEHLRIKEESQTVATITFQNFFRLYERLAGMTGTAMTEAKEFDRIYKLGVVSIPTNRPLRRVNHPDLIYGTLKEKYNAIVEHVADVHAIGRPILIGTVSIERSEVLSEMLKRRGVKHEVLNARHHAREAEIVARAGQFAAVTVATNMAGRGTDIVLGEPSIEEVITHWQRWGLAPKKGISPDMPEAEMREMLHRQWVRHYLPDIKEDYASKDREEWDRLLRERWYEMGIDGPVLATRVAEMGGLHIIGTERHEARRIDNQLRGRSGRQGDPGSSRFFLSMEDDTMRMFAPEKARKFMQWAGLKDGMPIESRMVSRTVENAQRKVEERNFEIRKNLLEYDQVMNDQRKVIYERRQKWVKGEELKESMLEYCENHINAAVQEYVSGHYEEWDLPALCDMMEDTFLIKVKVEELEAKKELPEPQDAICDLLFEKLRQAYDRKEEMIGAKAMRDLEKMILLETVDRKWMDHLYEMDLLKEGIHLWGYAGQDPKIRYKRDGWQKFDELLVSLEDEVASLIMKVHMGPPPGAEGETEAGGDTYEFTPRERIKIEAAVHDEFEAMAAEADAVGAGAGEVHYEPIVKTEKKIKPNSPCPCGSGKKYKKCCGRK